MPIIIGSCVGAFFIVIMSMYITKKFNKTKMPIFTNVISDIVNPIYNSESNTKENEYLSPTTYYSQINNTYDEIHVYSNPNFYSVNEYDNNQYDNNQYDNNQISNENNENNYYDVATDNTNDRQL